MLVNPERFHVVVVGAGPVGLWTAVQTKLLNPELEVVVLDKDEKFYRTHNLYLEAQSLNNDCRSPELEEIIKKFKLQYPIPIETLVGSLSELAKKIGIVFQNKFPVNRPDVDLAPFTNAQVIVGADGAYSLMREKVVGETGEACFSKKEDLHYIADLTYEEEKPPVKQMVKVSLNSEVGNCIYEIHSKKKKKTTLRTFVSEEVHKRLKHPRPTGSEEIKPESRQPLTLDSPNLDPAVRQEFLTFLNAKYEGEAAKHIDLSKSVVNSTKLGSYVSKQFIKAEGKRIFALVGDAAFGVPFFLSLNNGFISGRYLAKAISGHFDKSHQGKKLGANPTFEQYAKFMQNLANKQVRYASIKSFFINLWIKIAKAFHLMPSPRHWLMAASSKPSWRKSAAKIS